MAKGPRSGSRVRAQACRIFRERSWGRLSAWLPLSLVGFGFRVPLQRKSEPTLSPRINCCSSCRRFPSVYILDRVPFLLISLLHSVNVRPSLRMLKEGIRLDQVKTYCRWFSG